MKDDFYSAVNSFEHRLWEKGEEIRQLIAKEHKELNKEQSARVCHIFLDKNAICNEAKKYINRCN